MTFGEYRLIRREELRGFTNRKRKIDEEYPHCERINLLRTENDLKKIKSVFESFHEDEKRDRGGHKKYYCIFEGEEIVINFNPGQQSYMHSKFKGILERAKQKVLDALIG